MPDRGVSGAAAGPSAVQPTARPTVARRSVRTDTSLRPVDGLEGQLADGRVVLCDRPHQAAGTTPRPRARRSPTRRPRARRRPSRPPAPTATAGVAWNHAAHASQPRRARPPRSASTADQDAAAYRRRGAVPARPELSGRCELARSSQSASLPRLRAMPQHPQRRDGSRPRAGYRLMHVHAHPDDESSKGAASTARTSPRASTSTSSPAPAASAARSSTRRWSGPTSSRTSPRSAARRWSGPATSSASRQDWLGFVDSGWPEGDPKPPLPEGCFALVPVEEAAERLVRLIRELPARTS